MMPVCTREHALPAFPKSLLTHTALLEPKIPDPYLCFPLFCCLPLHWQVSFPRHLQITTISVFVLGPGDVLEMGF